MAAQHARPRALPARSTQTRARRPAAIEGPLEAALAPLARHVTGALVCELLPGVGSLTFGDPCVLASVVGRVVLAAIEGRAAGDLHVRVARQFAGWAPTKTVMVTLLARDRGDVTELAHEEIVLPCADVASDDDGAARAPRRVLVADARARASESGTFAAVSVDGPLTELLARLRDDRTHGLPVTLEARRGSGAPLDPTDPTIAEPALADEVRGAIASARPRSASRAAAALATAAMRVTRAR